MAGRGVLAWSAIRRQQALSIIGWIEPKLACARKCPGCRVGRSEVIRAAPRSVWWTMPTQFNAGFDVPSRRLIAVLCLGLCAEISATSVADVLSEPPPGTYVNLDTHRLYYHCLGSGAPTVVIDAGIGASSLEWEPFMQALATDTRVCAYDRAGYGWSDPGPGPRTTELAVSELHQLLSQANITQPYVMLGHSFGGFTVRYFAASFPDEVDAVILVDSSHPERIPQISRGAGAQMNAIDVNALNKTLQQSNPYAGASRYLNSRRKAIFAQMNELSAFAVSAAQVDAKAASISQPVTVIARDPASNAEGATQAAAWHALQQDLRAISADSDFVAIAGADHNIHLSQPERLLTVVRQTLARLRQHQATQR